jgi:hypothetical protein
MDFGGRVSAPLVRLIYKFALRLHNIEGKRRWFVAKEFCDGKYRNM